MELFVLGAGSGYTQDDVTEMARAWTGHGIDTTSRTYQFTANAGAGRLAAQGITTGVGGSSRFEPNAPVTRAEMVTFLWRFAGQPPASGPMRFSDVSTGLFYSVPVMWAAAEGITTGVAGTGRFNPSAHVTRGEMATFLWRYARQPQPAQQANFADVPRTSFFAVPVDFLAQHAITTGVGGTNRFEPGSPVTRGEMATFLWRFDQAGFRAR